MNLSAFLAQNVQKPEPVFYVASSRFKDENGQPVAWEIRSIDSDVDEKLRNSCLIQVPVPGKSGQFTRETDINRYVGKLAAACTVFPDLKSKELQDSYGVMGEEQLLKKMLISGEYANYIKKVQEANGFDLDVTQQVEEAKN